MRLPLLICATFQILIVSATSPHVVEWNTTHSYGADGPWPVVTIRVGKDGDGGALSSMDLHPGGIWESMLPTKAFCDSSGSPDPCLAENAGLYNVNASSAVLRKFSDEPAWVWQWGSESAFNMSGQANNVLDHMGIQTVQGRVDVDNATLAAVDRSQITLPDGTNYSIQVGSLSLGCPIDGNQSFETGVRGGTVPGTLRSENIIASNSFGLHYGSVSLGQVGSLIWGGYDQSRVLGNVGSFDLNNDNRMVSSLQDIQIGVEEGSSPFSAGSFKGLLKLDPTFSGVGPTFINPVVPYLFLSPETCSAITENLPVTFQPDIGLYIWNTAVPQYQNIVKSPAYLAFIFQDTGVGNITIKVPFRLLNLTLEAPIVSSPQQCFPC